MPSKITKAVVPLLGCDPALLPATKARPKEMLPLLEKTILDLALDEVVASGIEELVVVTRFNLQSVKRHLDGDEDLELQHLLERAGEKPDVVGIVRTHSDRTRVTYVRSRQSDQFWDMLSPARNAISDEPFAVILPAEVVSSEQPNLKALMEFYDKHRTASAAVTERPPGELEQSPTRFGGMWNSEGLGSGVCRLIPHTENEALIHPRLHLAGRFVLESTFFDYVEPPNDDHVGRQLARTLSNYAKQNSVIGIRIGGRYASTETRRGYLIATVEAGIRQPDVGVAFANYLSRVRDAA